MGFVKARELCYLRREVVAPAVPVTSRNEREESASGGCSGEGVTGTGVRVTVVGG